MSNRDSTCANCVFFQPHEWDETSGTCHRAPPTHDGFPSVEGDDWCGEWDDAADVVGFTPEEPN